MVWRAKAAFLKPPEISTVAELARWKTEPPEGGFHAGGPPGTLTGNCPGQDAGRESGSTFRRGSCFARGPGAWPLCPLAGMGTWGPGFRIKRGAVIYVPWNRDVADCRVFC